MIPHPSAPPSLAFSSPASAAPRRRVLVPGGFSETEPRLDAPQGNLNGWLAEHAQRTHDQQVYIDRNRLGVLSLKQKEALEVPNRLESTPSEWHKVKGNWNMFFFF